MMKVIISKSPEYRSWLHMRERCNNPRCADWPRYGGRGITVCDRWRYFKNFLADVGPRPTVKHSIDRHPNRDGNYEPGNVRWANPVQQSRNRDWGKFLDYKGEQVRMSEVAEKHNLTTDQLSKRLIWGWSLEKALATPIGGADASETLRRAWIARRKAKPFSSVFHGVHFSNYKSHRAKWTASIRKDKKTIYIGRFKREENAAQAYNFVALELFGENAKFNESPSARLVQNVRLEIK